MKYLVSYRYPMWNFPLRVRIEANSPEKARERLIEQESAEVDATSIIIDSIKAVDENGTV